MKHFLITRFNLRNEDWILAKDGTAVLTEKWLTQRLDLFKKYCLPSVLNQNNKNFIWVILFDINTPQPFRSQIEKLSDNERKFKTLYLDGMNNLSHCIKQFIMKQIDEKDKFIITSRLDNDDAIHESFIETIQKLARPKHGAVIDIVKGYQMNISNNIYEYRNHFKYFNPFISVVESSDIAETVFSKMHFEWHVSKPLITYNAKPLWIETIHDKNKANTVRINFPLVRQIKLQEFGIKEELQFHNMPKILIHNFRLLFNKVVTRIITKTDKN